MAANARGAMRPSNANRTPSFIFIGLLVVIAILGFNYWNVTSKNAMLSKKLNDMSDRFRKSSVDKAAAETRFEEAQLRISESEKEANRQKSIVNQKGEELNSLTSQISEAHQKLDTAVEEQTQCKQDLDAAFTKQIAFENIEASLRAEKAEKDEELQTCQAEKMQAIEEKRDECNQVGDAVRIKLLTTVQKLFGDQALELLQQNNVNIVGLTLGAVPQGQVVLQPQQQQQQLTDQQQQQQQQQPDQQQQPLQNQYQNQLQLNTNQLQQQPDQQQPQYQPPQQQQQDAGPQAPQAQDTFVPQPAVAVQGGNNTESSAQDSLSNATIQANATGQGNVTGLGSATSLSPEKLGPTQSTPTPIQGEKKRAKTNVDKSEKKKAKKNAKRSKSKSGGPDNKEHSAASNGTKGVNRRNRPMWQNIQSLRNFRGGEGDQQVIGQGQDPNQAPPHQLYQPPQMAPADTQGQPPMGPLGAEPVQPGLGAQQGPEGINQGEAPRGVATMKEGESQQEDEAEPRGEQDLEQDGPAQQVQAPVGEDLQDPAEGDDDVEAYDNEEYDEEKAIPVNDGDDEQYDTADADDDRADAGQYDDGQPAADDGDGNDDDDDDDYQYMEGNDQLRFQQADNADNEEGDDLVRLDNERL